MANGIPRIVVGGVSSSSGKTTVMTALAGALRGAGLQVACFKCGPDYLDPTWHRRSSGRPAHNLDGWMMGREAVLRTFERGSRGADIALIEGVMGLFDGASPTSDEGSTAQIARWLQAPVLLTVDAGGMARTMAALVAGFCEFDPRLDLAGVLANRVGSAGHLDLLKEALNGRVPFVFGLPKKPAERFPERYLGLHAARDDGRYDPLVKTWAGIGREWLPADELLQLAARSGPLPAAPLPAGGRSGPRVRVALARDEAFQFYYEDNLSLLEAAGAELIPFSPLTDTALPAGVGGVYLGGGYPEVHAEELAANRSMHESLRSFAADGGPVYGECGGLMYLCQAIQREGRDHPMAALLPGTAVLTDKLQALGYVEVTTRRDSPLGPAGQTFRGHQFRYSRLEEVGEGETYQVRRKRNGQTHAEGYHSQNVLGSWVHAHWASQPGVAAAWVESCRRFGGQHGG